MRSTLSGLLGDGTYVIRQIDESSLPPLGEPLEPPLSPLSPRDAPAEADDVPSDDGSEIDVMVVYTPLAKHREGGRAAIEALIDLFVAETNQAYANSGVTHRIRLVLREEVDYIEDGDSLIDLGRLLDDSDGYMDHVHERARYVRVQTSFTYWSAEAMCAAVRTSIVASRRQ